LLNYSEGREPEAHIVKGLRTLCLLLKSLTKVGPIKHK